MKVPMNASALSGNLGGKNFSKAVDRLRLRIQNLQHVIRKAALQPFQALLQQQKNLAGVVPHGLIQRALIENSEGLGTVIGMLGVGGQRQMQLCRALTKI